LRPRGGDEFREEGGDDPPDESEQAVHGEDRFLPGAGGVERRGGREQDARGAHAGDLGVDVVDRLLLERLLPLVVDAQLHELAPQLADRGRLRFLVAADVGELFDEPFALVLDRDVEPFLQRAQAGAAVHDLAVDHQQRHGPRLVRGLRHRLGAAVVGHGEDGPDVGDLLGEEFFGLVKALGFGLDQFGLILQRREVQPAAFDLTLQQLLLHGEDAAIRQLVELDRRPRALGRMLCQNLIDGAPVVADQLVDGGFV